MRIYIANLGKYNEGILKGAWLDLPFTDTEREEAFIKAGLGYYDEEGDYVHGVVEIDEEGWEYHYEEFAIHDHEYCPFDVEEYSNLDQLNEWAELAEGLDEVELQVVEEVCKHEAEDFETVADWLNEGSITIYRDCRDMGDVVREYVASCGELRHAFSKDQIEYCFDEDALMRDLEMGGDLSEYAWNDAKEVFDNLEDSWAIDTIERYGYEVEENLDEDAEEPYTVHCTVDDLHGAMLDDYDYCKAFLEMVMENMSDDFMDRYFDYDKMGRDFEIEGNFIQIDSDTIVEVHP